MTPRARAVITFISSPWGRAMRIGGGVALWVGAVVTGGWAWLLALPGTLMVITGVMNYCPAGFMVTRPQERSEFFASLKPVNLLETK